jgi:glycosyltransferase involved in cell wall biosynthesis
MEKRLKIAVFHNLPSGGAKRALYDHVTYLINSGHTVDIFIPSTANEDYLSLESIATNFKVFPVSKNFKSYILSLIKYRLPVGELNSLENAQKLIADEINSGDYDVVFCEQDQYSMSPFILKYITKPVVYYCQQPLRHDEAILKKISKQQSNINKNSIKKFVYHYIDNRFVSIDKKLANFAEYTLANSYFSRESILRTYGINSYVCYLGIDNNLFRPINIPKEDFVLSVGSYISMKGHDFIIKSLALIPPKIRPKFILVSNNGDDEWKECIEDLAKSLGVELEILTLINDEKLVELYNQAKLVLYSPHLEPFGLVPLEAMACGTPVVAVKEGGVRETIVHNKTGLLTEGDETLFSKSIEKLLLDDTKRLKMGEESVEEVTNHWTLENAGKRLEWHLNRAKR